MPSFSKESIAYTPCPLGGLTLWEEYSIPKFYSAPTWLTRLHLLSYQTFRCFPFFSRIPEASKFQLYLHLQFISLRVIVSPRKGPSSVISSIEHCCKEKFVSFRQKNLSLVQRVQSLGRRENKLLPYSVFKRKINAIATKPSSQKRHPYYYYYIHQEYAIRAHKIREGKMSCRVLTSHRRAAFSLLTLFHQI